MTPTSPRYKWYLVTLSALTIAFSVGAPAVSLAVLFQEIIADLRLDLVQTGLLWSIGSLPAIFISPLSGALIDRFGPKRVMLVGLFLLALTAGMRGLATDFTSLLLIILVVGGLVPPVMNSTFKVCGLWFPHQQLGLANGLLAVGMALGGLLGALLSATIISPWLGGWRNVMYFYGALAMLFCLPWYFSQPEKAAATDSPQLPTVSMRDAFAHVIRLKNVWLLGITLMGIGGCMQGMTGYLALYLRGLQWEAASADGALSLLSAVSMISILPLALLSDRLGNRKMLALGMILVLAITTGLLAPGIGPLVWGSLILGGMVRDSSASQVLTMVIETEGVGPLYAGTAAGFVTLLLFIGNLLSPPIGNHLAQISPGLPFVFWAGLAVMGLVSLAFAKGRTTTQPA